VTSSLTVGTGANSAVQKAAILGGYTVFENSAGTGNPSITFNNDTDTGILNNGANVLQFNTAGVERARFNQTGAFVLYGGTGAANGIGIAFPTTQVASSDANTLDDYEEGTFTPTVIGTTTAGTIGTYFAQTGRYTKVGNIVTVQIYLAYNGGTGTGNLAFAGLPFTIANNGNEYAVAAIGQFDTISLTALNVPTLFGSPNSARFDLHQFPTGGGATVAVPYDAAGAIMFTSTYFVA